MIVRRAFADLPGRQVHYRHCGSGNALLLLHAGPGSAKQLAGLAAVMGQTFRAIAPDMPGNGDSDPLPIPAPAIADYAAALLPFMDAVGIDRADVYGSHTGAAIAAELAIIAPERVGRMVMDGLGMFEAERRDQFLANYAQPFTPDLDGAYLLRAFHFLRDQYLFFPWYDRTAAALRGSGLRSAEELHDWLVEVLKAAETYHMAYRAAFLWDAMARLPLVVADTLLISAKDDPLLPDTKMAAGLMASARFAALPDWGDPQFADRQAQFVRDHFCDGH